MASDRFLLVQLADIGDLVLTTPAMAALREAHPSATIHLLAAEHALPCLPGGLVDAIIPFRSGKNASRALFSRSNLPVLQELWRFRYDAVVFFHHFTKRAGVLKFWLIAKASGARRLVGLQNHNVKFLTDTTADHGFGGEHQAQYWLNLVAQLGASSEARPAKVRREAFAFEAPSDTDAPTVVIHPGSGGYSRARRWLPQRFARVAQSLQESHDAQIILVGTLDDDGKAVSNWLNGDCVDLIGKTTLPQLADIIARADLFIGADSGVMHIAAATGTPVVSIFGPSNSDAWRPWTAGTASIVLRSGVECSPCSYVGHRIGAREGCAARTCMKLVTVDQVIRAADKLLASDTATDYGNRRETLPPVFSHRIDILGVPVHAITYDNWLQQIDNWIRGQFSAQHVCTVNPEFVMIAWGDPIFFNILHRAAICVPDGVGLLWASRRLGAPLPERVTGSDGVPLIARHAAERGWKIFFLGAAEGVARKAAEILRARHLGLQIAGAFSGGPSEAEEDEIVELVNASGADILFVAFGAPNQDKWIARNLPRLKVSMAMGVGGSFDFIAGIVPRAPSWMQKHGLEWLYRLLRQPWRLKRMLRLPRFVLAVMRHTMR
ncbi:MAG: WecB/TagA/CpsF family glycosyltransferase [Chloroflexi bacterium]|nr:WecB/TagA/CpsF family glycosyltransferase [Chloroflexota bacterium]